MQRSAACWRIAAQVEKDSPWRNYNCLDAKVDRLLELAPTPELSPDLHLRIIGALAPSLQPCEANAGGPCAGWAVCIDFLVICRGADRHDGRYGIPHAGRLAVRRICPARASASESPSIECILAFNLAVLSVSARSPERRACRKLCLERSCSLFSVGRQYKLFLSSAGELNRIRLTCRLRHLFAIGLSRTEGVRTWAL